MLIPVSVHGNSRRLLYFRVQQFMRIVWDEAKRLTNLAKHGLDFADLDAELFL